MKLLMISWQNFITKRDDGGKQASYRLYELAKSVCPDMELIIFTKDKIKSEENCIFLPSHMNPISRSLNILSGHMFTSSFIEKTLLEKIKSENFDTILLDRSMYGKLARNIKQDIPDIRIWVFFHNIEKNYFLNKIKGKSPLFKLPYRAICKSEAETVKYADRIMTLTTRDSETLYEIYGKKADQALPMAFYDSFDESRLTSIKDNHFDGSIIFIGSMFGPNYEGIKWFTENVMPVFPDYNLKIVGKNFEKKKDDFIGQNIEVIGTVDDLSEYYYANNIMVMPIPYGDGIKIKTAEALIYGKTILASKEALVGYEVSDVDGIYCCETAENYINIIRRLYKEKALTYSPSVRQLFLDKYCLSKQIEECKELWK